MAKGAKILVIDSNPATTKYLYQRSENAAFTMNVKTLAQDITDRTYTDPLPNGIASYYRVRPKTQDGVEGDWSNIEVVYPAPSTPVINISGKTETSITLTWNNQPFIKYYEILRNGVSIRSKAAGNELSGTTTTFTDSGLIGSTTYNYTVRAVNDTGSADGVVTATTNQPPSVSPNAITNFRVTNKTHNMIEFAWDEPYVGTRPFNYTMYVNGSAISVGQSQTYYRLTAENANGTPLKGNTTYLIDLTASNSSGATPRNTISMNVTTLADPVPTNPASASATRLSDTSIRITWSAVAGATKYRILVNGQTSMVIDNLSSTSYDWYGSYSNTGWTFTVMACNNSGCSSGTTTSKVWLPPTAPTNPRAEYQQTEKRMSVSVNATMQSGWSLNFYRNGSLITNQVSNIFYDYEVVAGQTYYYEIATIDYYGNLSMKVRTSSVTIPSSGVAPSAVRNLRVVNYVAGQYVDLAWDPPITGTTPISFTARIGSVSWSLGQGVTSGRINTSMTAPFSVEVYANNNAGAGPSSYVTVQAPSGSVPGIPGNFVQTSRTSSSITMSWSSPTSGTTPFSYYVKYKNRSTGSQQTYGPVSSTSATITGLSSGATYDMEVYATNSYGSGGSNYATAYTDSVSSTQPPSMPNGFTVSNKTANSLTLTWNPVSGATQYVLQVQKFSDNHNSGPIQNTWTTIYTGSATSYTHSGLSPHEYYSYKLTPKNSAGSGAYAHTGATTRYPSNSICANDDTGIESVVVADQDWIIVVCKATEGATSYQFLEGSTIKATKSGSDMISVGYDGEKYSYASWTSNAAPGSKITITIRARNSSGSTIKTTTLTQTLFPNIEGKYLELGSYNGKKILWRGMENHIWDPIFISDRIISFKAFDAKGDGTDGRGTTKQRANYGSNFYHRSNIKEWLNSSSYSVSYSHNAPTSSRVDANAYSSEPGFLYYWSERERKALKNYNWYAVCDTLDSSVKTSGSSAHNGSAGSMSNLYGNYATCYKVAETSGFVNLPNIEFMKRYFADAGKDNRAYPTAEAVSKNSESSSTSSYAKYWLADADTDGEGEDVVYVTATGTYSKDGNAYRGGFGVRPCIYVRGDSILGGSGTQSDPYKLVL